MLCGDAIEEYNIIEYFIHTYEEVMETCYKDQDNEVVDKMTDKHCGPGCKQNKCILSIQSMARSFALSILMVTTNFLTSLVISFLMLMILLQILLCLYVVTPQTMEEYLHQFETPSH